MPSSVPLSVVVDALESLYPPGTAQSWDRVGLVAGDPDQPVARVLLALDPTLAVIEEAITARCDLLVTHHPLLLRGVHSVATTSAKGASVTRLVAAGVALYVAHTNADVAATGVARALAAATGLLDPQPLTESEGQALGRVGDLATPMTLGEFAGAVHASLPQAPAGLRVSGDPRAQVRRVAVLPGAGDDSFEAARRCGADVYVTADLRHHPALEAREEARGGRPYLIDTGHWASEAVWLPLLRESLAGILGRGGGGSPRVEILISDLCTDPWTFTVGAANRKGMP